METAGNTVNEIGPPIGAFRLPNNSSAFEWMVRLNRVKSC